MEENHRDQMEQSSVCDTVIALTFFIALTFTFIALTFTSSNALGCKLQTCCLLVPKVDVELGHF